MGRRPCCAKEGLNRGPWSAREDKILTSYIKIHGKGKWRNLPQRAGLKRCGKSCRLRWLNYLRPDIKRGNISMEEEELIIKLHKLLGNRWSLIVGRLPGRTDNEIKNYWNTTLSKRVQGHNTQLIRKKRQNKMKEKGFTTNSSVGLKAGSTVETHQVIRTKAVRCTRVIIPQLLADNQTVRENLVPIWNHDNHSSTALQDEDDDASRLLMDFDISDLLISDILNSDFHQARDAIEYETVVGGDYNDKNMSSYSDFPVSAHEAMLESLQPKALDLETLESFFNSDEDEKLLSVVP